MKALWRSLLLPVLLCAGCTESEPEAGAQFTIEETDFLVLPLSDFGSKAYENEVFGFRDWELGALPASERASVVPKYFVVVNLIANEPDAELFLHDLAESSPSFKYSYPSYFAVLDSLDAGIRAEGETSWLVPQDVPLLRATRDKVMAHFGDEDAVRGRARLLTEASMERREELRKSIEDYVRKHPPGD